MSGIEQRNGQRKPMDLQHQQLNLVQEWNEAKEQLKYWTEKESDLRSKVVQDIFKSDKTEGTETVELAGDWKLKVTKKLNYNVSNKDETLTNILNSLPALVAQNVIRWNPDLNLAVYRKLDTTMRELLSPVISIKPAKPSLELVPPNANSVHQ
jgi:hypothetical protein